jgi:hypothetical protein
VSASRHWPLPRALECRPGPHYPSIYLQESPAACHRLCCTNEPTSGPRTTSHNERGCLYVRAHTARDNTMQCNAIPPFIATTKASDSLAAHDKTRYTHRTLLQSHEPVDTHFTVSKILGALLRLCIGRYRSTFLRLYSEFFTAQWLLSVPPV